jgi:hypothetical protein
MTNYDEINARRLAERRLAEDPQKRRLANMEQSRRNVDVAEQLAAEVHSLWEAKGFPGESWLEVEGTEKMARNIVLLDGSPDDDSEGWSLVYVMIDGRLVHYRKSVRTPRIPGAVSTTEIHFSTYREYVEQQMSQGAVGADMTHDTARTIRRLEYVLQTL